MPDRTVDGAQATGLDAELRSAARGGGITFVGAMFSTAMGFVLAVVLARQLGPAGSGVVLQTIAAFMISLSLGRLGMDTTAVWIVPRLKLEEPGLVARAVTGLLISAAAASIVLVVAWLAVEPWVSGGPLGESGVAESLNAVCWFLPLASVMLVGLATTRGFGGVLPFNLIGNVAVPLARPVLVLVVTVLGGSVVAAAVAWAAPVLPAVLATLIVLWLQVRRMGTTLDLELSWRPTWAVQRRLLAFGLPRTLSSALEQSTIWFDVVLVGVIAGAAAAGVYGATSRFVAAGVVVLTALRVVVAPRFSALLAEGRTEELRELYRVTASWILLFGSPIYIVLAVFAPTVLSLLGPDFVEGRWAMVVLSVGALFVLAGGNVHTLLFMSGHSGWSAINRTVVFGTNVAANFVLVPLYGLLGAAFAWAFCMGLDTTLALIQVRRFTGIQLSLARFLEVLAITVTATLTPAVLSRMLLGQNALGLALGLVLAGGCVLGYAFVARRRLRLDQLAGLVSKAPPGASASVVS